LVPAPKKLKKDESESSPHLVASTSRLFKEILISAFAMYYKTGTEYEFFLIMNFVI
jgi:hypothetical protein